MQNLFFSTGEGDTIAQDSRCKSSLSEAATFWLASSGCPFASARLRDILSRTVFKYFFRNAMSSYDTVWSSNEGLAKTCKEPTRQISGLSRAEANRYPELASPKSGCFAQRAFASATLSNCVTVTCWRKTDFAFQLPSDPHRWIFLHVLHFHVFIPFWKLLT